MRTLDIRNRNNYGFLILVIMLSTARVNRHLTENIFRWKTLYKMLLLYSSKLVAAISGQN